MAVSLELLEENTDSMDEDTISNMNQEISPAQGPTLPILQKVINLSSSVQVKQNSLLFFINLINFFLVYVLISGSRN